MSRNETIVTSAADIDRAFAKCPALYNEIADLFESRLEFLRKQWPERVTLSVKRPVQQDNGFWTNPSILYTIDGGEPKHLPIWISTGYSDRRDPQPCPAFDVVEVCSTKFKRLKAGGFNVARITAELNDALARRVREYDESNSAAAANALAARLRSELGYTSEYGTPISGSRWVHNGRTGRECIPPAGQVHVSLGGYMTPEQAKQLIEFARKIGVTK